MEAKPGYLRCKFAIRSSADSIHQSNCPSELLVRVPIDDFRTRGRPRADVLVY